MIEYGNGVMAHLIPKEVFISLLLLGLQVKGTASAIQCPVGLSVCLTAKDCFDPVTQFCCDSTVTNSDRGHECCHLGGNLSKVYHPDEQMCCKNKLRKRNKPADVICCDDQIRSTNLGLCCNNVWRETFGTDDRACCGSEDYNIKTDHCCTKLTPTAGIQSEVLRRTPNSACCGLQLYDTVNQRCGSGDKIRKQFEFDCGALAYDSRRQECCKGTRVIDSSTHICCGDKGQHVDDEICCRDPYTGTAQVFTKTPNRVCCGSSYVDDTDGQICCNDKIYQMDPANGACCNGVLIPGTNGNGFQCCGSHIYDPDEYQCSNKKIFPKTMKICGHEETDCVCNGEIINREKKLCCKWLPVIKSGIEDDKCCTQNSKQITFNSKYTVSNPCMNTVKCTNGQMYDDTKYICCGGNVLNKHVFGESCCRNIAYHKTKKRCKNGRLRPTKLDSKCRKIKRKCKSDSQGQTLDDNIKGVLITGKLGKQRCRKDTESFELRELDMHVHGIKYDLFNIRSLVGVHKLKIVIPRKRSLECLPENGSKMAILINPRRFLKKASESDGKIKYRLHPRRDKLLFSNPDRKNNRYQVITIKRPTKV